MKNVYAIAVIAAVCLGSEAAAQSRIYDTITSLGAYKTYRYPGPAYLMGDIFTPGGGGPISKIDVVYVSTLRSGGRYTISATVWDGVFQTPVGYVEGEFVIPPLTPPHTEETWLLTFSPLNIPLTPNQAPYGISFITSPVVGSIGRGNFVPLVGFNPTLVGTDYTGISIDTNLNGILEPYLPIPDQEWFNPSPTSAHTNLLCTLYQMHAPSASMGPGFEKPRFTAKRIDLQNPTRAGLNAALKR